MSSHGIIVVSRADEYSYAARSFKVRIDGVTAGKVKVGATAEFPVAPGSHRVEAAVDVYRSEPLVLEVSAGERYELALSTGPRHRAFLRPNRYLLLQRPAR